jgi:hypothetical protein
MPVLFISMYSFYYLKGRDRSRLDDNIRMDLREIG